MKKVLVKVNSGNQTVSQVEVVTKDGKPTIIQGGKNVNYQLTDLATGRAPQHLVTKRVGKDLHISFEENGNEADLIIQDFYNGSDNALVGLAEDGQYYHYVPDTGKVADYVTELQNGDIEGQALGGQAQATPWWVGSSEGNKVAVMPWILGLGGLGAIGAVILANNKDKKSDTTPANEVAGKPSIASISNPNNPKDTDLDIQTTPAGNNDKVTITYIDEKGVAHTIVGTKNGNTWTAIVDGKPVSTTQSTTEPYIDPASGTITLPKASVDNGKPVKTVGEKTGATPSETVLLPKPVLSAKQNGTVEVEISNDTDKVEISFKKEDGSDAKVELTKTNGTWVVTTGNDLVQLNGNKVTIAADKVKDNSDVTAIAKDNKGNSSDKAVEKALSPTLTPATKPVVDTGTTPDQEGDRDVMVTPGADNSKVTVEYNDEKGQKHTIVATKKDGTWSATKDDQPVGTQKTDGETPFINTNTGVITLPKDSVDNNTVSVTALKDGGTPVTLTPAAKPVVDTGTIPDQDGDRDVTVTPGADNSKVTVEYNDEKGQKHTIVATKKDGTWSATKDDQPVGTQKTDGETPFINTNTGVITLPKDSVDNNSVSVTALKDGGTPVTLTPAAKPVVDTGTTPDQEGDRDVMVTPGADNNKVTVAYNDEKGQKHTIVATKKDGTWSATKDDQPVGTQKTDGETPFINTNTGVITLPKDSVDNNTVSVTALKDGGTPVTLTPAAKPVVDTGTIPDQDGDRDVMVTPGADNSKVTVAYNDEKGQKHTIVATKKDGTWSATKDDQPVGTQKTDGETPFINTNTGVITLPKDSVDNNSVSVTALKDGGTPVTLTPAAKPVVDTGTTPDQEGDRDVMVTPGADNNKVTVAYNDEKGQKHTIVATKKDGTWSATKDDQPVGTQKTDGETPFINTNTGVITLPKDSVDNNSVSVTALKDGGTPVTLTPAAKPVVDTGTTPDQEGDRDVMVTPGADNNKVTVAYNDEKGQKHTIVATKKDGTWSATKDDQPVGTQKTDGETPFINTNTGVITLPKDSVDNNSVSVTALKDGGTPVTLTPAAKPVVDTGTTPDQEGDRDVMVTPGADNNKVTVAYNDEKGQKHTIVATKKDGTWSATKDDQPVGTQKTDGETPFINTNTGVITLPKDSVDNNSVSVTALKDGGTPVTLTPAAKPVVDTGTTPDQEGDRDVMVTPGADNNKVTVAYNDEKGQKHTIVATKKDGTWSATKDDQPVGTQKTDGETPFINTNTGVITLPKDSVDNNKNVTVTALKDGGTPFTTVRGDDNPPHIQGKPVLDKGGKVIKVPFNEDIDGDNLPDPDKGAFSVTVEGKEVPVASISIDPEDPKSVLVTLDQRVLQGKPVKISYDPTTDNDAKAVQDKAGNDADSFTDQETTNGSTIVPPAVEANADGSVDVVVPETASQGTKIQVQVPVRTDNPATNGNPQTVTLTKKSDGTWTSTHGNLVSDVPANGTTAKIAPNVAKNQEKVTVSILDGDDQPVADSTKDATVNDAIAPSQPTLSPQEGGAVKVGLPTDAQNGDKVTLKVTDPTDNTEKTITLTKGNDGWKSDGSAVTITADEATIPANKVKYGSTVIANAFDAADNTKGDVAIEVKSPDTTKVPVGLAVTPEDNGAVTIKFPSNGSTEAGDTVAVKVTDPTGAEHVVTYTKQKNGTWEAKDGEAAKATTAGLAPTVAQDGTLNIAPEKVQDGSKVTATVTDTGSDPLKVIEESTNALAGGDDTIVDSKNPPVGLAVTPEDNGAVTIKFPSNGSTEAGDTVAVKVTDPTGAEHVVTYTKQKNGTWEAKDGEAAKATTAGLAPTVAQDGTLNIAPEKVQDGSKVTATVTDTGSDPLKVIEESTNALAGGDDTIVDSKNPPVGLAVTPEDNGAVTIKFPSNGSTEAGDTVAVKVTDPTGAEHVVTYTKQKNGTWEAKDGEAAKATTAGLAPTVAQDGTLNIAPEKVQDGSKVTATVTDTGSDPLKVIEESTNALAGGDDTIVDSKNPPVGLAVTPEDNGAVTIKFPSNGSTEAGDTVAVKVTDPTGAEHVVTYTKQKNGTWEAKDGEAAKATTAGLAPTVAQDGTLNIAPEKVQDGSKVTATVTDTGSDPLKVIEESTNALAGGDDTIVDSKNPPVGLAVTPEDNGAVTIKFPSNGSTEAGDTVAVKVTDPTGAEHVVTYTKQKNGTWEAKDGEAAKATTAGLAPTVAQDGTLNIAPEKVQDGSKVTATVTDTGSDPLKVIEESTNALAGGDDTIVDSKNPPVGLAVTPEDNGAVTIKFPSNGSTEAGDTVAVKVTDPTGAEHVVTYTKQKNGTWEAKDGEAAKATTAGLAPTVAQDGTLNIAPEKVQDGSKVTATVTDTGSDPLKVIEESTNALAGGDDTIVDSKNPPVGLAVTPEDNGAVTIKFPSNGSTEAGDTVAVKVTDPTGAEHVVTYTKQKNGTWEAKDGEAAKATTAGLAPTVAQDGTLNIAPEKVQDGSKVTATVTDTGSDPLKVIEESTNALAGGDDTIVDSKNPPVGLAVTPEDNGAVTIKFPSNGSTEAGDTVAVKVTDPTGAEHVVTYTKQKNGTWEAKDGEAAKATTAGLAPTVAQDGTLNIAPEKVQDGSKVTATVTDTGSDPLKVIEESTNALAGGDDTIVDSKNPPVGLAVTPEDNGAVTIKFPSNGSTEAGDTVAVKVTDPTGAEHVVTYTKQKNGTWEAKDGEAAKATTAGLAPTVAQDGTLNIAPEKVQDGSKVTATVTDTGSDPLKVIEESTNALAGGDDTIVDSKNPPVGLAVTPEDNGAVTIKFPSNGSTEAGDTVAVKVTDPTGAEHVVTYTKQKNGTWEAKDGEAAKATTAGLAPTVAQDGTLNIAPEKVQDGSKVTATVTDTGSDPLKVIEESTNALAGGDDTIVDSKNPPVGLAVTPEDNGAVTIKFPSNGSTEAGDTVAVKVTDPTGAEHVVTYTKQKNGTWEAKDGEAAKATTAGLAPTVAQDGTLNIAPEKVQDGSKVTATVTDTGSDPLKVIEESTNALAGGDDTIVDSKNPPVGLAVTPEDNGAVTIKFPSNGSTEAGDTVAVKVTDPTGAEHVVTYTKQKNGTWEAKDGEAAKATTAGLAPTVAQDGTLNIAPEKVQDGSKVTATVTDTGSDPLKVIEESTNALAGGDDTIVDSKNPPVGLAVTPEDNGAVTIKFPSNGSTEAGDTVAVKVTDPTGAEHVVTYTKQKNGTWEAKDGEAAKATTAGLAPTVAQDGTLNIAPEKVQDGSKVTATVTDTGSDPLKVIEESTNALAGGDDTIVDSKNPPVGLAVTPEDNGAVTIKFPSNGSTEAGDTVAVKVTDPTGAEHVVTYTKQKNGTWEAKDGEAAKATTAGLAPTVAQDGTLNIAPEKVQDGSKVTATVTDTGSDPLKVIEESTNALAGGDDTIVDSKNPPVGLAVTPEDNGAVTIKFPSNGSTEAGDTVAVKVTDPTGAEHVVTYTKQKNGTWEAKDGEAAKATTAGLAPTVAQDGTLNIAPEKVQDGSKVTATVTDTGSDPLKVIEESTNALAGGDDTIVDSKNPPVGLAVTPEDNGAVTIKFPSNGSTEAGDTVAVKVTDPTGAEHVVTYTKQKNGTWEAKDGEAAKATTAGLAPTVAQDGTLNIAPEKVQDGSKVTATVTDTGSDPLKVIEESTNALAGGDDTIVDSKNPPVGLAVTPEDNGAVTIKFPSNGSTEAGDTVAVKVTDPTGAEHVVTYTKQKNGTWEAKDGEAAKATTAGLAPTVAQDGTLNIAPEKVQDGSKVTATVTDTGSDPLKVIEESTNALAGGDDTIVDSKNPPVGLAVTPEDNGAVTIKFPSNGSTEAGDTVAVKVTDPTGAEHVVTYTKQKNGTWEAKDGEAAKATTAGLAPTVAQDGTLNIAPEKVQDGSKVTATVTDTGSDPLKVIEESTNALAGGDDTIVDSKNPPVGLAVTPEDNGAVTIKFPSNGSTEAGDTVAVKVTDPTGAEHVVTYTKQKNGTWEAKDGEAAKATTAGLAPTVAQDGTLNIAPEKVQDGSKVTATVTDTGSDPLKVIEESTNALAGGDDTIVDSKNPPVGLAVTPEDNGAVTIKFPSNGSTEAGDTVAVKVTDPTGAEHVVTYTKQKNGTWEAKDGEAAKATTAGLAPTVAQDGTLNIAPEKVQDGSKVTATVTDTGSDPLKVIEESTNALAGGDDTIVDSKNPPVGLAVTPEDNGAVTIKFPSNGSTEAGDTVAVKVTDPTGAEHVVTYTKQKNGTWEAKDGEAAKATTAGLAPTVAQDGTLNIAPEKVQDGSKVTATVTDTGSDPLKVIEESTNALAGGDDTIVDSKNPPVGLAVTPEDNGAVTIKFPSNGSTEAGDTVAVKVTDPTGAEHVVTYTKQKNGTWEAKDGEAAKATTAGLAPTVAQDGTLNIAPEKVQDGSKVTATVTDTGSDPLKVIEESTNALAGGDDTIVDSKNPPVGLAVTPEDNGAVTIKFPSNGSTEAGDTVAVKVTDPTGAEHVVTYTKQKNGTWEAKDGEAAKATTAGLAPTVAQDGTLNIAPEKVQDGSKVTATVTDTGSDPLKVIEESTNALAGGDDTIVDSKNPPVGLAVTPEDNGAVTIKFPSNGSTEAGDTVAVKVTDPTGAEHVVTYTKQKNGTWEAKDGEAAKATTAGLAPTVAQDGTLNIAPEKVQDGSKVTATVTDTGSDPLKVIEESTNALAGGDDTIVDSKNPPVGLAVTPEDNGAVTIKFPSNGSTEAGDTVAVKVTDPTGAEHVVTYTKQKNGTWEAKDGEAAKATTAGLAPTVAQDGTLNIAPEKVQDGSKVTATVTDTGSDPLKVIEESTNALAGGDDTIVDSKNPPVGLAVTPEDNGAVTIKFPSNGSTEAGDTVAVKVTDPTGAEHVVTYTKQKNGTWEAKDGEAAKATTAGLAPTVAQDGTLNIAPEKVQDGSKVTATVTDTGSDPLHTDTQTANASAGGDPINIQITKVIDNVTAKGSQNIDKNGYTNDNTPTLQVSLDRALGATEKLQVTVNDRVVEGIWKEGAKNTKTFTPTTALGQGVAEFKVELVGRTGTKSDAYSVTVDTIRPFIKYQNNKDILGIDDGSTITVGAKTPIVFLSTEKIYATLPAQYPISLSKKDGAKKTLSIGEGSGLVFHPSELLTDVIDGIYKYKTTITPEQGWEEGGYEVTTDVHHTFTDAAGNEVRWKGAKAIYTGRDGNFDFKVAPAPDATVQADGVVTAPASASEGGHLVTTVKLVAGKETKLKIDRTGTAADGDFGTPTYTATKKADGSAAMVGASLTFTDGKLTVPAGVTEFTISTPVLKDAEFETETVGYAVGNVAGNIVNITDTTLAVKSVNNATTVDEGAVVNTTITLTRAVNATDGTVTINLGRKFERAEAGDIEIITVQGGAYNARNNTITVNRGQNQVVVKTKILADNATEGAEKFGYGAKIGAQPEKVGDFVTINDTSRTPLPKSLPIVDAPTAKAGSETINITVPTNDVKLEKLNIAFGATQDSVQAAGSSITWGGSATQGSAITVVAAEANATTNQGIDIGDVNTVAAVASVTHANRGINPRAATLTKTNLQMGYELNINGEKLAEHNINFGDIYVYETSNSFGVERPIKSQVWGWKAKASDDDYFVFKPRNHEVTVGGKRYDIILSDVKIVNPQIAPDNPDNQLTDDQIAKRAKDSLVKDLNRLTDQESDKVHDDLKGAGRDAILQDAIVLSSPEGGSPRFDMKFKVIPKGGNAIEPATLPSAQKGKIAGTGKWTKGATHGVELEPKEGDGSQFNVKKGNAIIGTFEGKDDGSYIFTPTEGMHKIDRGENLSFTLAHGNSDLTINLTGAYVADVKGKSPEELVESVYTVKNAHTDFVSLVSAKADMIDLTGAAKTLQGVTLTQVKEYYKNHTDQGVLYIKGDQGDTVALGDVISGDKQMDGATEWVKSGTQKGVGADAANVYDVWLNGATQLYIDQDITVL